ncbi:hypothetical protein BE22_0072 [Staphylococcus phage vB_SepS_BE22]|uniref:Uncharacterized protein n=1 Tax=Staphylococcus phage 6ec TaxID=1500386 RepID=A0A060AL30_9CAUD|nr:hypothetical protein PHAGE6E_137 [Staphylococcus phage 6ec]AIA64163.1 hypothetical protein PHAGE6E_137 [Staphylococcus phage 6ec]WEU70158.1 hypothetical protein BE22_0072 [Staphylococcus phage vB_SepS_BE22]
MVTKMITLYILAHWRMSKEKKKQSELYFAYTR